MKLVFSKRLIFLLVLLLANMFTWLIIFQALRFQEKIAFLNVGQGDAELIHYQAGNILIDAGPNNKILFELSKVLPFYDRTIDLFILSHPNKDHYNGLFELFDKYKIKAVMLNNYTYPSSSFQKLVEELKKRHILIIQGFKGVRIHLGENTNYQDELLTLYPPKNLMFSNEANNSCLVLDFFSRNNQFLFTGDIGSAQENKLLSSFSFPPSQFNVLKVAHHGSNYSSSDVFLKSFHPQIAVIEVGENTYGQPHLDTLTRLKNIGAQIFRTDIKGTIQFILENNALKMKIEHE
ncbi:MAG: ComEC/Rec2 family competence protein [Minisyncoccia bacterium]